MGEPHPFQGTLPTSNERPGREPATSERPPAPGDLLPGAQLGKYRVVRRLGAGGMGAVYEAVHADIGKSVALKVLSPDLAAEETARSRFLREAAALSRLEHPHVVQVTDYGSDAAMPFLVMEMLRGEDLGHRLRAHPRGLGIDQAVDILLAVSAGVFAAHQAGIIHRDIKPRNIFLVLDNPKEPVVPKVLDFGISKLASELVDASLTESGVILGTTPYLSPEQARGDTADARSDQFALGVVLYECLTGRTPHDGGGSRFVLLQNIAQGKLFPPSALRRDLPPAIEAVVMQALSLRPADRFQSVFHFAHALLPFASPRARLLWSPYFGAEGPPVAAHPEPALDPGTRRLLQPPAGPLPTTREAPRAPSPDPPEPYRDPFPSYPSTTPHRGGRTTLVVSVALIAATATALAGWLLMSAGTSPPPTVPQPTAAAPTTSPSVPASAERERPAPETATSISLPPPAPPRATAPEPVESNAIDDVAPRPRREVRPKKSIRPPAGSSPRDTKRTPARPGTAAPRQVEYERGVPLLGL